MRRIPLGMLMILWSFAATAAQTPAGTVITNSATLTFAPEGGPPDTATSNTAAFTVVELINVTLQWEDASPVSVNSPDTLDALTFRITNTGNGTESFALARNNAPAIADNYDPLSSATPLYLETNGTPGLQTGVGGDTALTTDLTLSAEESRVLYVMSDTPASLAIGNTGQLALTATSTTTGAAGAAPGTALPGLGDGGVAAVVGLTQARSSANGIHIVSGLALNVLKTVAVDGGGDAAPGKTLTYTITVMLTGTGTAGNLLVTDPVPAELTYVAGSITVNAASRTDAVDTDNTEFSANTVNVNFGNTAAPMMHVITFKASVN
jgi:uncharacterized repeat protein (TIGR01451 family)